MHCDHWISLLVLSIFAVSSRAYTTEELNSVTLVLDVTLEEYQQNVEIQSTLFFLIANYSTIHCTAPRTDCTLSAKYLRNTGEYKREITEADYVFTSDGITELKAAEVWTDPSDSSILGTTVVFNLKTQTTGYDYLKWTDLVRLLYSYTPTINEIFYNATNTTTDLLKLPPTSYIAKVIADNRTTPTIIACVILGSALILFIVLIPLSNTKYCRKELDDSFTEEAATETAS